MNIQKITLYSPSIQKKNTNGVNTTQFKFNNYLTQDTISFSGKSKKVQDQHIHEKNGIEFGKQIYSMLLNGLNANDIIKKLNKDCPDLTIKDISELWEYGIKPEAYRAYFLSTLKDDFIPKNMCLFLSLDDNLETDTDKLLLAMDIAHEYTHYSQVSGQEYYKELSKIADGDPEYAGILTALGDFLFSYFDINYMPSFTDYIFKDAEFSASLQPIPKQAYINKQEMLNKFGMENESVFKRYTNHVFDRQFIKMIETIADNPQMADENILKRLGEAFKRSESIEKLKSDLKKYCKIQAKREMEARSSESNLAKKIMKTSKPINYDIFPVYFEMLEKALN